eukprot:scaffold188542_cov30-Tisochrysis_lutea.AAC.7
MIKSLGGGALRRDGVRIGSSLRPRDRTGGGCPEAVGEEDNLRGTSRSCSESDCEDGGELKASDDDASTAGVDSTDAARSSEAKSPGVEHSWAVGRVACAVGVVGFAGDGSARGDELRDREVGLGRAYVKRPEVELSTAGGGYTGMSIACFCNGGMSEAVKGSGESSSPCMSVSSWCS